LGQVGCDTVIRWKYREREGWLFNFLISSKGVSQYKGLSFFFFLVLFFFKELFLGWEEGVFLNVGVEWNEVKWLFYSKINLLYKMQLFTWHQACN
jgi:hypothetical protein